MIGSAAGRRFTTCAAVGAWLVGLAGVCVADETGALGVRLAREGRCEAALPELDRVRLDSAEDETLALLAGQCRIRLRRYDEAVRDLEQAEALAPERTDIQLALAKARYHAGDVVGAGAALDRAQSEYVADAEFQLYRGMVALQSEAPAAAVTALERALELDPDRVEPIASYYLGLALAEDAQPERADRVLQRVASAWAGTDWSTQAERQLDRLREGERRRAWAIVGAGFEHDSNVVLRGRGVTLPRDISDEADQRGVFTANGGLELWKNDSVTLGAMASYRGTAHVDLEEFNAHFPSVTAWLDALVTERTRARLRYDFGYAWLDTDPFGTTQNAIASVAHVWRAGTTEVFGGSHYDEYFFESDDVRGGAACVPDQLCGPAALDESRARDRDGWGIVAGLDHTLPVPTGDLPVRAAALHAGYGFTSFESRGREYTYDAHEVGGGLSAFLPFEITIAASAAYAYKPYRHASSFPGPSGVNVGVPYTLSGVRRRDDVVRVETELSRLVTEHATLAARWRYVDNRSTSDVFDYNQHILGIYLTVGGGTDL